MNSFNCPNCGHALPRPISKAKMATCESCGSTIFLTGSGGRVIGHQGEMHDVPLVFGLGDKIFTGHSTITLMGHARYSYGRGFWDEFWGVDRNGDEAWISVDEGDIFVQRPISPSSAPRLKTPPDVGHKFDFGLDQYTVTERESATCIAVSGQFGETLKVGETYQFVNAISENGKFLSGEFHDGHTWYVGKWLDPYDFPIRGQS